MPTVRSPQVLRRLLPYYHPYRGQVAVGLASVVVAAALSTLVPGFLQRGIDAIIADAWKWHAEVEPTAFEA